jgi:hypothetical protein
VSVPATAVVRKLGLDTGDLELSGVTIRVMPSWMSRMLGGGVAAITLSDTIFVSSERYERVIGGEMPILLLHELVHVGQWRREGRAAFLLQYSSEYLRNRLIGLDHRVTFPWRIGATGKCSWSSSVERSPR